MPLLSKKGREASQTQGGSYLSPSKIVPGTPLRFCLVDTSQILESYELWGNDSDGNGHPMRFIAEPTEEEIEEELEGRGYTRRLDFSGKKNEVPKFVISFPVYDQRHRES